MTPTPRAGTTGIRMIYLAIFVLTGMILAFSMSSALRAKPGGDHSGIVLASVCGVVASFAMFLDLGDLWLRGRRLARASAAYLRFVAVAGSLLAMFVAVFARNNTVPLALIPSLAIYYFAVRPPRAARERAGAAPRRTPAGPANSSVKARQRRGGRKRK